MIAAIVRAKFLEANPVNLLLTNEIALAQYQSLERAYISASGVNGLKFESEFYYV